MGELDTWKTLTTTWACWTHRRSDLSRRRGRGMHLGLKIPSDSDFHPGETWNGELALALRGQRSFPGLDFVAKGDRPPSWLPTGDQLQGWRTGLAGSTGSCKGERWCVI